MSDDDVVGHKTFRDGGGGFRHEPLTRAEANALHEHAEQLKRQRAIDMPTDLDAVKALWRAQYRLEELGWKPARLAPSGITAPIIELGSAGIHVGRKDEGEHWWIDSEGDQWPSRPVLYKPLDPA
jgi:hypothetical protein